MNGPPGRPGGAGPQGSPGAAGPGPGEARTRAVFESAGVGIAVTDRDGRFLEVNAAWAAYLGYGQDELRRLGTLDVTHPEDLESSRSHAERLFEGEIGAYTQEKRWVRKDGRVVWGLLTATPLRDGEGRVESAVGVVVDITRRKRMESELAMAAQRLSLATQGAGIGIWDWDIVNDALVWDDDMYRMYGLRREDFGGAYQAWRAALDPADVDRAEEDIQAALRGEREFAPEFRIRWPDGSVHHIQALARTLRDAGGRPLRMAGINIDITARKEAEERIRENERFLSALTAALPGLVGYWTPELRCTFANQAFQTWVGRTPEQMIGMHAREFLGEELFRRNEPAMRAALAGEPQRFEREFTVPDGSTRYAWGHYIPDVSDGEVRGIVALVSDVTELKRAQLELQRLNETLQERTRQAESASRAKSDFLANVSHEIRTPMNAIMGMSELLERSTLAPRQREYLVRIRHASRSLLGLLNDVLDLSKIEAGKLELEHVAFDLGEVVRQVEGLVAERAQEKGLALSCEIAADVPLRLVGDPLRLGQVLLNLASNAVKFTERGSVRLAVDRVATEGDRARLRFSIRDTGVGIPAQAMPRIFEAFGQADSSTTRRFGGTGLGLTISRRLVELLGGALEVESAPDQGSTFSFAAALEVQPATQAPAEWAADQPAGARARCRARVLVAEDNEANRLVAREFLEAAGVEVVEARDGREATARALDAGAPVDLVLMDIQMPSMDGFEAAARIRASRPALPIIAVTAHAMGSERQRCLDAGMRDHLAKPFGARDLEAVIDRWLPREPAPPTPPTPPPRPARPASAVPPAPEPADGSGDGEATRRFLAALQRDLELLLAQLLQARQEGDAAAARSAAHALKGLALPLALEPLREEARALERALRAGEPWAARAEALEGRARELLGGSLRSA